MLGNILLTLFLVLLNGFFVAAEFAIVKVRTSQIQVRTQKNLAARVAASVIGNLDAYLAATQLGITLASLGLGWIGEGVVSEIILSTDGLGAYLKQQQSSFNVTKVMTAIVVIAIVSVFVNGLTNWANRRLLDWHFRRAALAGR